MNNILAFPLIPSPQRRIRFIPARPHYINCSFHRGVLGEQPNHPSLRKLNPTLGWFMKQFAHMKFTGRFAGEAKVLKYCHNSARDLFIYHSKQIRLQRAENKFRLVSKYMYWSSGLLKMHQGQAFSIMGIFIFLPKQKKKAKGEDKQAGGECVCFPAVQCCAQACLCVQACECNCCLLSLSKLRMHNNLWRANLGILPVTLDACE